MKTLVVTLDRHCVTRRAVLQLSLRLCQAAANVLSSWFGVASGDGAALPSQVERSKPHREAPVDLGYNIRIKKKADEGARESQIKQNS